jgi:hypothetical protein
VSCISLRRPWQTSTPIPPSTRPLAPLGIRVVGVHESGRPRSAIADAQVLFVGGGNSFRLLRTCQRLDLLDLARERVGSDSLMYWALSAGSNLACPTIRTTNDMPLVPDLTASPFYVLGSCSGQPARVPRVVGAPVKYVPGSGLSALLAIQPRFGHVA